MIYYDWTEDGAQSRVRIWDSQATATLAYLKGQPYSLSEALLKDHFNESYDNHSQNREPIAN
jgi:hypothetical protein